MSSRRLICLSFMGLIYILTFYREGISQTVTNSNSMPSVIRCVENEEIAAIRSGSGNQIFSWDREADVSYAWGEGFGDASDWREIVTGDFDGDGIDEIVAIRKSSGAKLYFWDWDGSHQVAQFEGWGSASEWRGLAAGDFDNDGRDEVVAVRTNVSGAQFIIWDENGLCSQSWGAGFGDGSDWRGVAAGDLTGDGVDDVVALRRSSGKDIYCWTIQGQSRTLFKETGNYGDGSDWRGLTVGDFDRDGVDEAAAVRTGVSTEQFFIWDLQDGDVVRADTAWGSGFGNSSDWRGIEAGDFDADGADEIVAIRKSDGDNIHIFDWNDRMTQLFGGYGGGSDWRGLATGDFDADGADEITAVRTNVSGDQFFIWDFAWENDPDDTGDQWGADFGDASDWRGIAVGNFDGDNVRLVWTGNQYRYSTPSSVVAYLSVPPFDLNHMKGVSTFSTLYGEGEVEEETRTNSIAVSSSATLSFGIQDPIGAFGTSFGYTVERSLRRSRGTGSSKEVYTSYPNIGSPDDPEAEDAVVAVVTHYDLYEYEYQEWDGNTVTSSHTMLISVPDSIEKKSYELSQSPISSSQSDHIVGQVTSYPFQLRASGDELVHAEDYQWVTDATSSPWSAKFGEIDITTVEQSFGINFFGEVTAGGVTFGTSVGLTTGSTHTISIGKYTEFAGVTGPVDTSFYEFMYRPYVWRTPGGYVAIDYLVDPSTLGYGYFPDFSIASRDIGWRGDTLWVNVHNLGHNSNNVDDQPVEVTAYSIVGGSEQFIGSASMDFIPGEDSTYARIPLDNITAYTRIRVKIDPYNKIEEHNASWPTPGLQEAGDNNNADKSIVDIGKDRISWDTATKITLQDSIFVLSDSLSIPQGKTLKIQDATLLIHSTTSTQYAVLIDGTLELRNSWIAAVDPEYTYIYFKSVSGNYLPIQNSGMRDHNNLANLTVSLSFSNNQPVEGETVNIMATVQNQSSEFKFNGIEIAFYDGNPDGNGIEITSATIDSLIPSGTEVITTFWNTEGEAGDHQIYAILDPLNIHQETNEGDNVVSSSLHVNQSPQIVHQPLDRAQFVLPGETYEVTSQITDADGDLDSLKLFYRTDTGAGWSGWTCIQMNTTSPDVYTASIPSQTPSTQVEYYIYARDRLGNKTFYPAIQGSYCSFCTLESVDFGVGKEFSGRYASHNGYEVGYQWFKVFIPDTLMGIPLFLSSVEPTSGGPGFPEIQVFENLNDSVPSEVFTDSKLLWIWMPPDSGNYFFKVIRSHSNYRYFGFGVMRLEDMEPLYTGWSVQGEKIDCDLSSPSPDFLDFFAVTAQDTLPYFLEIRTDELDIYWRVYKIDGTDISRSVSTIGEGYTKELDYGISEVIGSLGETGKRSGPISNQSLLTTTALSPGPIRFELWGPHSPEGVPETVILVLTGGKDGGESSGSYNVSYTQSTTPPGQSGGEEGLSLWPGQSKSGTIGANEPPVHFTNWWVEPGSYWLTCRARRGSPVQPMIYVYDGTGTQAAMERVDGFLPLTVTQGQRYWFSVVNPSMEENLDYEIDFDDSTTIPEFTGILDEQGLHPRTNPFEIYKIPMDVQYAYTLEAENITANGYLQLFDRIGGYSVATGDDPETIETFYPSRNDFFILMTQTYTFESTFRLKVTSFPAGAVAPKITSTLQYIDTYDITGPYKIETTVTDRSLTNVKLVYRVNGGSWAEVAMTNPQGDGYEAEIPGAPSGSTVEYYISAEDSDNNVTTDPPGAPASFLTFQILAPRILSLSQEYSGLYSNLGVEWLQISNLKAGQSYYLTSAEPDSAGPDFPQVEACTSAFGSPERSFRSRELLWWFCPNKDTTYYFRVMQSTSGGSEYGFLLNRLEDFTPLSSENDSSLDALDCNLAGGATDILDLFACTSTTEDSFRIKVDMSLTDIVWRIYDVWGNRIAQPLTQVWGPYAAQSTPETMLLVLTGAGADSSSEGPYEIRTELVEVPTGVDDPLPVSSSVPHDYGLSQNYPNPFNLETTINYQLPTKDRVVIDVFNILGQRVCTLVDGPKEAGVHTVRWDGRNDRGNIVGSGIYIYQMRAGSFRKSRKFVVIK